MNARYEANKNKMPPDQGPEGKYSTNNIIT